MKPTVLIVDDKPNFLTLLSKVLRRDVQVVTARGVREAIAAIDSATPAAIVCDLRMPDGDGLEVLRALRSRGSRAPFILMTAYATVATAVQALREGAYDYLTKPFDPDELRALVLRALGESAILARGDLDESEAVVGTESVQPSTAPDPRGSERFGRLIGRSTAMSELYRMIDRVAGTDATVLVTGETGVGKELVAQEIHERSPRAPHRMVAVNCAAIPRALLESELFGYSKGSFTGANADRAGLFEEASGASLFLDEVGEMRLTLQAKLTRVLEQRAVRRIGEPRERKIDVRLIAATHRNLPEMVSRGEFREDLWYRLNVYEVRVPALRERADDIPTLAHHFLAARAPKGPEGFTPEAMALLVAHRWPGNVRELRSAVERAAIVEEGRLIRADSLPPDIQGRGGTAGRAGSEPVTEMTYREVVDTARDDATRRYLEALLTKHRGNVTNAAAQAGLERESFHRLLRRHDVRAEGFRAGIPVVPSGRPPDDDDDEK